MVADFHKKRNSDFFTEALMFKAIGVFFIFVIAVLAMIDFKVYHKKKELNLQIDVYQRQIEEIKKSSQNLKEEMANSNSKEYYEKLAYEQFDSARPGEIVYSFIMPPQKPKIGQEPKGFWNIFSSRLSGALSWIKSQF